MSSCLCLKCMQTHNLISILCHFSSCQISILSHKQWMEWEIFHNDEPTGNDRPFQQLISASFSSLFWLYDPQPLIWSHYSEWACFHTWKPSVFTDWTTVCCLPTTLRLTKLLSKRPACTAKQLRVESEVKRGVYIGLLFCEQNTAPI